MDQDTLQVLLVEDQPAEARLFRARLEEVAPDEVGVKVEHASRLREAAGRLATTHYDAILLDLSLPDSHGVETVQHLLKGAADTPIIVLTGTHDGRVAVESLSLGAQDYLVKETADAPSLRRALRYAIERKRTEAALRRAHDELELRVRDRTEELREARDAAQAANRAKSEFLATMSHELRTPLSGMLGTIGLLAQTRLDEEQGRLATLAQSSGDALLSLINDILDFSKIDAGKLELEETDFDLHAAINGVASILDANAHTKNLELICEIDPGVTPRVRGDPNRVRQVLINLVGNAVKFTDKGGVVIRVTAEEGPGGGSAVRFAVTDTGIGIPRERLHRLFQTFFQVDASTTRKYGGTGLGLAISERLVTAMGGRIGVTSTPGLGSTFWFTIPFKTASTGSADSPPIAIFPTRRIDETEPPPKVVAGKIARILLAEDYEVNQLVLKTILAKAGYECDVVASGKAAVRAINGGDYDLVLMDCQMPEMDGFEATRLIRQAEQRPTPGATGKTHLPIIALTAGALKNDRERCLRAGMDDYVTKPLTASRLIAVVRTHLAPANPAPGLSPDEPTLHSNLGDERTKEHLPDFVADLPVQVDRLRKAMIDQDLLLLGRVLHHLKGAAGMYGFTPIARLAECIEDAMGVTTSIAPLVLEIEKLINLIRRIKNYDGNRERVKVDLQR